MPRGFCTFFLAIFALAVVASDAYFRMPDMAHGQASMEDIFEFRDPYVPHKRNAYKMMKAESKNSDLYRSTTPRNTNYIHKQKPKAKGTGELSYIPYRLRGARK